jgi:hypothetical protein
LGEFNIETNPDCNDDDDCADEIQDIEVESFIVHPDYNPKLAKTTQSYQNDIGLIRLKEAARIQNENIGKICLPFDGNANKITKNYVVSGRFYKCKKVFFFFSILLKFLRLGSNDQFQFLSSSSESHTSTLRQCNVCNKIEERYQT